MCGISCSLVGFEKSKYWDLLTNSEIRGQDGTGFVLHKHATEPIYASHYVTEKSNSKASLMKNSFHKLEAGDVIIGQNRLAIFGLDSINQQPIVTHSTALVHNGNLVDFERVFREEELERKYKVDSELILRLWEKYLSIQAIYDKVQGDFACILMDKVSKRIHIFTRYKPLYTYEDDSGEYWFSTDRIGMKTFGVTGAKIKNGHIVTRKYV